MLWHIMISLQLWQEVKILAIKWSTAGCIFQALVQGSWLSFGEQVNGCCVTAQLHGVGWMHHYFCFCQLWPIIMWIIQVEDCYIMAILFTKLEPFASYYTLIWKIKIGISWYTCLDAGQLHVKFQQKTILTLMLKNNIDDCDITR